MKDLQNEPNDKVAIEAGAEGDARDAEIRVDMDAGLRFLHLLGMQTKLDVLDAVTRLQALTEELIARGQIDLESLESRRERIHKTQVERSRTQAVVQVAANVDKYEVASPPVDCAALIPICKGRCCRLSFPLSFQDIDERVVKWNYTEPYRIRKRLDLYCVHSDAETHGCQVYEQRPAVCRSYDCRDDKRIWLDFEKRIPAPFEAIESSSATADPTPV